MEMQGKQDKKKVSIVMMSTFSGNSFKAPQLKSLVHCLAKQNLLANSFGMPENEDKIEYSEDELRYLKRNWVMNIIMRVVNKILCTIGVNKSYLVRERIFGFFARLFFKADGEVVLLKPRPSSLVKYYRKKGKFVVVEASESHTEYTYEMIKLECQALSVPLVKNNYTNKDAIKDFAEGVMNADRLICLSRFSANTYKKRGISDNKIRVTGLTTGVPLIRPRHISSESVVYVSVANHSLLKGTLHLLRTWEKYKISNRLMIVGHVHKDLEPYIEDYKNDGNIIFTGSLSRDEIERIYISNKSVGVFLSVSEGFSRSVLECLSTSTPVIVTECCTCDIVENEKNGFIINPIDEKELYEKIVKYNNMLPEEYLSMAELAYEGASTVENNFLPKYVEALVK